MCEFFNVAVSALHISSAAVSSVVAWRAVCV